MRELRIADRLAAGHLPSISNRHLAIRISTIIYLTQAVAYDATEAASVSVANPAASEVETNDYLQRSPCR